MIFTKRLGVVGALLLVVIGVVELLQSGPPSVVSAPPIRAQVDQNWPLFGRDGANTRDAAMTEVNAGSVGRLKTAWTRDEGFGQVTWETYPIVASKVLYITTNTDEVEALDASTGKVRWIVAPAVSFFSSSPSAGADLPTNRGVAVAAGRIFELTYDCHLIALAAATGKLLWRAAVADSRLGYYGSSAPSIWGGLVYTGCGGGDSGARGFVAAYDAKSGRRIWRHWTVPAPGAGWVPAVGAHGGGAVWMPPVVDPTTGILYAASGNPSPKFLGSVRPGTNATTDGVLALNARTGVFLWFTSLVGHDIADYDTASPVAIFTVHKNGHDIRAVGEAGKSGLFAILNAATGKLLFPPVAFSRRAVQARPHGASLVCPGELGGSEYSPIAYSTAVHAAYISGLEACMVITPGTPSASRSHKPGQPDEGGTTRPGPDAPSGTFTAVDVNTGRVLWRRRLPHPMVGGAMVTDGGVVFAGDTGGTLYGFDAKTGHIVWRRVLNSGLGAAPIAYRLGGRSYIAVAAGGAAVSAQFHLGPVGGTFYAFVLASHR